jgi:MFS family permease
MVERKENMGSAIALNSAVFNIARLVGPSIAGFVVAYAGEGICFVSNAVSYMAIIGCLLAMRLPPHHNRRKDIHPAQDLKEGISYSLTNVHIRSILLLVATIALTGLSYLNLMPVIARDVLGGDSQTFGFLMGSVGLGAIAGALFVGSQKSFIGMWKILAVAAGIFGAGIVLSSFSRNFYLTAVLMAATGFGQMVQFACANTLIQNIVDDDKRGRVMSIYNVAILGLLPFGNLLMGWITDQIGAPLTLRIGGGIALLAALVFARGLGKFEKLE